MTRAASIAGLSLLAIAIAPGPARAIETLEQIFAAGNRAFAAGDHAAAIERYERLVDAGVDDPDVEFNLATARARRGEYGHAILHFERALWLRPSDDGAAGGLLAAERAIGRVRAEAEGEATVTPDPPVAEALARPFSEGFLAWMLLVTTFAFFALLGAWRFVRQESWRLAIGIAAPLSGVMMLVWAGGLIVKTDALGEGARAVVLSEGAALRDAPDPRAAELGTAHDGARVRLLAEQDGYAHVRTATGREGWMEAAHVEAIRR